MLYTPQHVQLIPESTNGRTPSSNGYGVALDVPSAGSGYGSYVVVASTGTSAAYGFTFNINGVSTATVTINSACVTIAYGSAGSEYDVVTDLLVSIRGAAPNDNMNLYLPLYVPANTNISMKFAWDNTIGSSAPLPYADLVLVSGSSGVTGIFNSFQGCDTYGITSNTVDPRGTDLSGSGNAGTYGTSVKLGTTTKQYGAVVLVPGCEVDSSMSAYTLYNKTTIGSGGTVIANYMAVQKGNETIFGPLPGMPVMVNLPTGVDLYSSMAVNTNNSITVDWAAYCFY